MIAKIYTSDSLLTIHLLNDIDGEELINELASNNPIGLEDKDGSIYYINTINITAIQIIKDAPIK